MQAAHGLIIVVTELLIQARIQVQINASKWFPPAFYFGPPDCHFRRIFGCPQDTPTIT